MINSTTLENNSRLQQLRRRQHSSAPQVKASAVLIPPLCTIYSILYFCTDLYYFYVCRLVVWYWMNAISSTALTYIWIVFSTYSTVYSGYKWFFERGKKLFLRFGAHLISGIPTISWSSGSINSIQVFTYIDSWYLYPEMIVPTQLGAYVFLNLRCVENVYAIVVKIKCKQGISVD